MNKEEFRSKVYGCWMGKNIGGTLGMPMEWERCKMILLIIPMI